MKTEILDAPLSRAAIAALLVVYFVWGSTYLAIRWAIESLPGFSMAGVRFLVAGGVLTAWGMWRHGARPARRHLLPSLGVGALLLLGGNGGVVWAEYRIDSGVAALLVAIEPVWVALLAPVVLGAARPGWRAFVGLALGVTGVAALVVDPRGLDASSVDPLGTLAVVLAALSWALGSLWTVRAELPSSRALATGLQMLAGGTLLLLFGGAQGEWNGLAPEAFSVRSLAAFAYLVVFGSIVAFSAYGFLLRAVAPSVVATYAFVNPVVAVWLGWLLAAEQLSWRVAVASLVILAAVAMIFRDSSVAARRRRALAAAPGRVAVGGDPQPAER